MVRKSLRPTRTGASPSDKTGRPAGLGDALVGIEYASITIDGAPCNVSARCEPNQPLVVSVAGIDVPLLYDGRRFVSRCGRFEFKHRMWNHVVNTPSVVALRVLRDFAP